MTLSRSLMFWYMLAQLQDSVAVNEWSNSEARAALAKGQACDPTNGR